MQDQLDTQVLNLAKSIRRAETGTSTNPYQAKGASGESGGYQFMPNTWKQWAGQHLGNPNAEMSVENQNKVAYNQIKGWKDQGYNPAQIASLWNSGNPEAYRNGLQGTNQQGVAYDVPAYVAKVSQYYREASKAAPKETAPSPELAAEQEGGYKPWFKASPGDSGLEAGLKAAGNVIPSAVNFGKGLISLINPVNAAKNIAQIPEAYREAKAANEGSGAAAVGKAITSLPGETAKAIIPESVQKLAKGDLSGASKQMTEDPFGQTAPVVLAGAGAAGAAGKSAQFGKAVETVAKPIVKPVEAVASKVGEMGGKVGVSTISHLTGMDAATIRQIISNPAEFSRLKREAVSRGNLSKEVKVAIDARMKDLSETGTGYEAFKNSTQSAKVPPDLIKSVLADSGLKIVKGKIKADTTSVTRNPSDIRALQRFYDTWGKKKDLTAKEFFNMRKDLSDLSKYDKLTGMGKTEASAKISRQIRDRANSQIRDIQFEELKVLDELYAPERAFLDNVRKDYFNKDGTFKDGSPSKIMNATNKAELLKRLEDVLPGVTKRIEILKAVEDIERASGVKVGAYGRLTAAGLGYAHSGIMGALVAEILTSPSMAVPILRQAGYLGTGAKPIVNTLRLVGGDIAGPKGGLISSFANKEATSTY